MHMIDFQISNTLFTSKYINANDNMDMTDLFWSALVLLCDSSKNTLHFDRLHMQKKLQLFTQAFQPEVFTPTMGCKCKLQFKFVQTCML